METVHDGFRAIILCLFIGLLLAKPFEEENANKLQCPGSREELDFERNSPNTFSSDYYKPRSKFEGSDKYSNGPFEFNKKRSPPEVYNVVDNSLQKRQVGVIYKNDRPIGILQPYQRSYRFIPVKDDTLNEDAVSELRDMTDNLPGIAEINKRDVNGINNLDSNALEESYPSILTNFKIGNKLDKKRNYDALTDENVQDLKSTIRRLRSSSPLDSGKIEEELKNILDDMGLIEDEEVHGEKREINEEQMDDEIKPLVENDIESDKERSKRQDMCTDNKNIDTNNNVGMSEPSLLNAYEKKNEIKGDTFSHSFQSRENKRESLPESASQKLREKRQKQELSQDVQKSNPELGTLKDSGDIMLSGNKLPLTASSEITERDTENQESDKLSFEDDKDYENRVERKIQSKINSLKEEVKREIDALKTRQNDDDTQRKKRQVFDTLINEESDVLNPAMNADGELEPLIRKRRGVQASVTEHRSIPNTRMKRETNLGTRNTKRSEPSLELQNKEKNYKIHQDDSEESDLLGGDEFNNRAISKREIYKADQKYKNSHRDFYETAIERNKRSGASFSKNSDLFDNYFDHSYSDDNVQMKNRNIRKRENLKQNPMKNRFTSKQSNSRIRRRINDGNVMGNRPQQLSDLSDLDLFGALPKSYDGELSRYKRVKRK